MAITITSSSRLKPLAAGKDVLELRSLIGCVFPPARTFRAGIPQKLPDRSAPRSTRAAERPVAGRAVRLDPVIRQPRKPASAAGREDQ